MVFISPVKHARAHVNGDHKLHMLDAAGVAIHGLDCDGRITYVNSAAARLLGWEAHELVGRRQHETIHHSRANGTRLPEDECRIAHTLRTAAEHTVDDEVFWRRDGSALAVEYTSTPLRDEYGELAGAVIVFRPIERRKPAGAPSGPAHAQALSRVASRLNAQLDLDAMLSTVCAEVQRSFDVDLAGIWLLDDKANVLRLASGVGIHAEVLARVSPLPHEALDSFARAPAASLVVPDVQSMPSLPDAPLFARLDLRTVAVAKLLHADRMLGLLSVGTLTSPREWSAEDLALLEALASQAAQAIENDRLVKQAHRRIAFVHALHEMDVAMGSSFDVRFTLNIFLEQLLTLLRVDAADVLLLRPSTQLEFATGRGFRTRALEYTRLRMGEGQAGIAARERRMVSVADLRESVGGFARAPLFQNEGFIAYYAMPLIARGQLQGVLEVFNRKSLEPDPEWLNALETIAGRAALVIDNATTFEGLQRTNLELLLTCDQMIEALSRAADLHVGDAEGQTLSVTEETLALARQLDVQEKQLVDIRRGALLHDIGSVAVPHQILLKPGPLSEPEWDIVRRHPTHAQQMLSPIAYLRPALEIPYSHHERWDGKGYPLGLKGEQIPLAARIFAVADAWHVLRAPRPYRPAWNDAQARRHLQAEAGAQFDPVVVDAFFAALR